MLIKRLVWVIHDFQFKLKERLFNDHYLDDVDFADTVIDFPGLVKYSPR